ncbi:MAG: NapC/NirT family cytochrome c [Phycisphaerae bacterium]|jgi:nitrate/TMAO reductase-like tetraheme cytochrome c subunit|nr:NapC/NirT family cytochrome c [Phycisphaerae bacterium]
MPDAPNDHEQNNKNSEKRPDHGRMFLNKVLYKCFGVLPWLLLILIRKWRISLLTPAVILGAALLTLELSEPFGEPDACTMCHEMQGVYDRWSASTHYINDSGVTVGCIKCHLPPREDTFAHVWGKISKGSGHGWVHFFGKFDEQKSRKLVLDTLSNERCTHCHNKLAAKSSTPAVGSVHSIALNEIDTRTYACVACHNRMHSPEPPPPEPEFYDKADNSYCYDCHMYLEREKEPLIVRHASVNIGCVDCHGKSQPHVDDESGETPPDIMYAKDQINVACGKKGCHSEKKLKKVTSHKAWFASAPAAQDKKYCTDCHGRHSVPDRVRKWDKKTRKLIWKDGYDVDPNAKPTTKPDGMDMDM